jgi:hypothetical protein
LAGSGPTSFGRGRPKSRPNSIAARQQALPGQVACQNTFNGLVFKFKGAPVITGATIDRVSNFMPESFGFTGKSFEFNLSGVTVTASSILVFDFTF